MTLQTSLYQECLDADWDPNGLNTFGDEMAHLHEELSEAFQAYRHSKGFEIWTDEKGKPQGVPIEFADVIIGMFYNAELRGFDLMEALEIKRAYNRTRNYVTEGRQLNA